MTLERSAPFLNWLDGWYETLPSVPLAEITGEDAARVAVMSVDLLVGFCSEGALASPRVGALGPKAAAFLSSAWEAGIRHLILNEDSHPQESPEFAAFPPHCIRGTREAETIAELQALPFLDQAVRVPKGSLNVGLEPAFDAWRARFPEVTNWILVGDCTDLCVYQAAMHLRLAANTRGRDETVWVPASLVDTYDLPVEIAQSIGALPHDGDLMHRLFLYHMALNGIRVVRDIAP
jgi:nicotinamidase-related amidase